jgi:hypothetical protein
LSGVSLSLQEIGCSAMDERHHSPRCGCLAAVCCCAAVALQPARAAVTTIQVHDGGACYCAPCRRIGMLLLVVVSGAVESRPALLWCGETCSSVVSQISVLVCDLCL